MRQYRPAVGNPGAAGKGQDGVEIWPQRQRPRERARLRRAAENQDARLSPSAFSNVLVIGNSPHKPKITAPFDRTGGG